MKIITKTKIIAGILCLSLVLACFVSCGNTEKSDGFSGDIGDIGDIGDKTVPFYEIKSDCPVPSAHGAYLCEGEEGYPLYGLNENTKMPMASTTKIMTALIALENLPLDKTVSVDARSVGVEGSSIYLYENEKLTVKDLLYGLMLESANDAATALALEISGSVEKFAELMNIRARSMGLENTGFTNPHGLDDENHYTSPKDLAALTVNALKNETFAEIAATKSYKQLSHDGSVKRVFSNHNRLLFTYDGAIGVKTGYTVRTGRCLVSAAKKDGLTLVAVTLGAHNDWQCHKDMLNWGFDNYKKVILARKGNSFGVLPISGGEGDKINISAAYGISVFTNKDFPLPEPQTEVIGIMLAPVKKGERVGRAVWYIGEKELASLPLCADNSIISGIKPTVWDKIINFFDSLFNI